MRTLSTGSMSSVILGAATGLRSQLGVASVVARSDPSLPSMFRHPWTRRLVLAAAAGELVVDKLPGTPSRLAPRGIVPDSRWGRWPPASAQTRQASWLPAAALGASSAAIAARLGHDARARLARQAPDWPSPSPRTPWRSRRPPRAPHADVRYGAGVMSHKGGQGSRNTGAVRRRDAVGDTSSAAPEGIPRRTAPPLRASVAKLGRCPPAGTRSRHGRERHPLSLPREAVAYIGGGPNRPVSG